MRVVKLGEVGVGHAADGLGLGPFASSAASGWLVSHADTYALPGLVLEPSMRTVALAATWTGLLTTAANRFGETTALGKVSSSQASVLLATEPLWAALFAALLLGEGLGLNGAAGGALIVGACVVNAADAANPGETSHEDPHSAPTNTQRSYLVKCITLATAPGKRTNQSPQGLHLKADGTPSTR